MALGLGTAEQRKDQVDIKSGTTGSNAMTGQQFSGREESSKMKTFNRRPHPSRPS